MNRRNLSFAFLFCAASQPVTAVHVAAQAPAQEETNMQAPALKKEESEENIVVYATRTPTTVFTAPAMVDRIRIEDLYAMGDLDDILRSVPGVDVDNSPRRLAQTPTLRGFSGGSVTLLIDGRRANFQSAHDGSMFLDPALLKSVEIVRGGASVLYGAGAVGGVVAFETKDAADMLPPGAERGYYTTFTYNSANEEYAPFISLFGKRGDTDALAALVYRQSDAIRLGGGSLLASEDRIVSGLLKLSHSFADGHKLGASYVGYTGDITEPNNGTTSILPVPNPIVQKDVNDHQISLKYAYDTDGAHPWLNPRAHLYYHDSSVEETDLGGPNDGRVQERKVSTTGFTFDNALRYEGRSIDTIFSYGVEFYRDKQVGTNSQTGERPGAPSGKTSLAGIFMQNALGRDLDGKGRIKATIAARYDYYRVTDDSSGAEKTFNRFTPKATVSYTHRNGLLLFASLSQAYRAPGITELFSTGLHFPGLGRLPANFFIPNTNLRAEIVNGWELGAGYRKDALFTESDRLRLKAAFFSSDGKDFLEQFVDIFAGFTQFRNVRDAELYGYEASLRYAGGPFELYGGLSYLRARDKTTRDFLNASRPLSVLLRIDYKIANTGLRLGWQGRFVGENTMVGAQNLPLESYQTHDLLLGWRKDKESAFFIDIALRNIFDEAYKSNFATLLEEGRSLNLRLGFGQSK